MSKEVEINIQIDPATVQRMEAASHMLAQSIQDDLGQKAEDVSHTIMQFGERFTAVIAPIIPAISYVAYAAAQRDEAIRQKMAEAMGVPPELVDAELANLFTREWLALNDSDHLAVTKLNLNMGHWRYVDPRLLDTSEDRWRYQKLVLTALPRWVWSQMRRLW